MSTKEITVQGITVEVAAPYAEGHTVTEAEAAALNQVRAENIRNNTARLVKAAMKEAEVDKADDLSDEILGELISKIAEYDESYEFTMASVGGGRAPADPVSKEAEKLARELIGAQLKANGKLVKDLDPEAYKAAIATVAAKDEVREQAKARIEERNAAAESALAGVEL